MPRIYLFISIVLLTVYVGNLTFQSYSDAYKNPSSTVTEETDLEDKEEKELEEIQSEIDLYHRYDLFGSIHVCLSSNAIDYSFAIKSHIANIQSPPPEL